MTGFEREKRMSRYWIAKRYVWTIFLAVSLGALVRPLTAQTLCATGTVCVKGWQQDTPSLCAGCAYRTGANLTETTITNSSIQNGTFGQLCSAQLDGQVYAQPLAVTGATIGGIRYDRVAYVVTQNDTLYAINGTPTGGTCSILGSLPFLSKANLPTNGQFATNCDAIGGRDCLVLKTMVGFL